MLCQVAIHQKKDIGVYVPSLESLLSDERETTFPLRETVGRQALTTLVCHHVNQENWEKVIELIQSSRERTKRVLDCFRGGTRRIDISAIRPQLDAALSDEDPELRGIAASVFIGFYFWENDATAIGRLLEARDYATRWYSLNALDDIAESGKDLMPSVEKSVLKILDHQDAELERDRNVKFGATLRELAAGVLIWKLIRTDSFHPSKKQHLVGGVDVAKVPEVRAQLRTLARDAGEVEE